MKTTCRIGLAVSFFLLALSTLSEARTLGVTVDRLSNMAIVFDVDTDTVIGTVPIPGNFLLNVVIEPKQGKAFISDHLVVWVVDITASPPRLAGGINPIPVGTFTQDMALSPDGRFLLVTDAGAPFPMSVIDTATQTELNTFGSPTLDASAVAICNNGSVLVTGFNQDSFRRLTLGADGVLTDTGDSQNYPQPVNVICTSNSAFGITVLGTNLIASAPTAGLQLLSAANTSGLLSNSLVTNPAETVVYARSADAGFVDAYGFSPTTGLLGAKLFTIPVAPISLFFGVETLAISPDGSRLYVPELQSVGVYDANSGALIRTITDPALFLPLGIAIAEITVTPIKIDIAPGNQANEVNLKRSGLLSVAILTDNTLNASDVDVASVKLGPNGAMEVHQRAHLEDIDKDKDLDLVLHFDIQQVGFVCGDTSVALTAKTKAGQQLTGSDSVKTIGCL